MADRSKKWVSRRVMEQQMQQPAPPPMHPQQQHQHQQHQQQRGGPGSKIMEDSAIAAQRIKEAQMQQAAGGATTTVIAEVPATVMYERQEATDALSNLAHSGDSEPFELRRDAVVKPQQSSTEFNDKMIKELETLTK